MRFPHAIALFMALFIALPTLIIGWYWIAAYEILVTYLTFTELKYWQKNNPKVFESNSN